MSLPLHTHIQRDGFRLRGVDLARIDAFSDVVFGFALTLLVVSLEVPKTYSEFHHSLGGFFPFAICFLFLMMAWHAHYKFFRRFGTHDFATIVINAVLLFFVLFYVYPLKFLFTFVTSVFTGHAAGSIETYQQLTELMILFGVGFATIYFLIAGLYWNGYRQRVTLGLSRLELLLTRGYIADSAGVACIGLLSGLAAWRLPPSNAGLAGFTFILIAIYRPLLARRIGRRAENMRRLESLHAPAA